MSERGTRVHSGFNLTSMQTKLTNEEILLNAINIAEGNGYPKQWRYRILDVKLQAPPDAFQDYIIQLSRSLVYDHEFAEKLFGEPFKLNLRDCVMEENPLNYLREYFALDTKQQKDKPVK